MAIISAATYATYTNTAYTGGDATALTAICTAVDVAIKKLLRPFVPEDQTFTDVVFDAPPGNVLWLPVYPVRSITSLYLRYWANGEVAAFTSSDLLTQYTQYYMPLDPIDGYSRRGQVFRRGASVWGFEQRFPLGRLAPQVEPNRGAVKATLVCGPSSVPADIVQAAVLAVSMIFARKVPGMPVTSESWNGGSYSLAAPFLTAVLASPDVQALLMPYMTTHVGVA